VSLTWLEIFALYLVIMAVTRALFLMPGVTGLLAARRRPRSKSRSRRQPPPQRPIEVIADDLRRLGARYRHFPRGTSYAKQEALRFAYDHALAEACACLEIEHLLAVLPPGPELDEERKRVEDSLWLLGLRFQEAA
jgi:hypothetical protein